MEAQINILSENGVRSKKKSEEREKMKWVWVYGIGGNRT